jgi:hypothetical protein
MTTRSAQRRWAWINGWGIPQTTFLEAVCAAWPHDEHIVFAPDPRALDHVRAARADVLAGYSLGALLLLSAEPWSTSQALVAVAPILAFDSEAGLAGTTPALTRELMRTKISAKPESMLKLFQRLAGLHGLVTSPLPASANDLEWGLAALGSLRAHPENTRRARLYAGAQDPLVAAQQLRPHTDSLHIVAEAGHDFRQLLPTVAHYE